MHLAAVNIGVRPGARRHGIGQALLDLALRTTRAAGRTVVSASTTYGPEPLPGPGALTAATGSGRIPADAAATRFALRNGFTFEQVDRYSVVALPVDPARLAALADSARAHAAGYRVLIWQDEVPEQWIDQFAVLESRMSTDAPSGGLDVTEVVWTAQQIREAGERAHAKGRGFLVAAAACGDALAAFTNVEYPLDRPSVVFQHDTLVLREHRGRRLGLLVKTALLAELARIRPGARRLHTWNAQENEHMLAINVALGFAPAGVEANWQRRLATTTVS
jgi:GNAT superfamily N-acetyltransferase